MTSSVILKKYLCALAVGIVLAITIFLLIDGIDESILRFVPATVALSLITIPIPIALVLKYESVKDLEENDIKEALRNTHLITSLISMFIEMIISYVIIGSPFGLIGVIAVLFVYSAYLIGNIITVNLFRIGTAVKDETPLDDL
jgi:hypothetical protein